MFIQAFKLLYLFKIFYNIPEFQTSARIIALFSLFSIEFLCKHLYICVKIS